MMIVVLTFKDSEVEVITNAKSLRDFPGVVEVRSGDSDVARYEKNEIVKVDIVWR